MSRSDRNSLFKAIGLVAFIMIGVTVLVSALSSKSNWYHQSATERAYGYAANANDQILRACPSSPNPGQCVDEVKQTARANQREEQDLAAQRITAWWTQIMGAAAICGMVLSAVGVWLVYTTFDATRQANSISRETAEKSLRPYLLVQGLRVNPKFDAGLGYWEFAFDFINNGQTPARIVSAMTGREIVNGPTPSFDEVALQDAPEGMPVIPKDGTFTFTTNVGIPALERVVRVMAGGLRLNQVLAVVKIEYRRVTDAETEPYRSERGRLIGITKHPDDDYGEGSTMAGEDTRVRLDHIS